MAWHSTQKSSLYNLLLSWMWWCDSHAATQGAGSGAQDRCIAIAASKGHKILPGVYLHQLTVAILLVLVTVITGSVLLAQYAAVHRV